MAWSVEEKKRRLAEVRKAQEARGVKEYVDPVSGKTTTTKGGAPKGSVAYTPDMGTSTSSVQKAIGYQPNKTNVQPGAVAETGDTINPIDAEYDALRRSRVEGLKGAAAETVAGMKESQALIDPRARESKTAAAVGGQKLAGRLSEVMANRGYATGDQRQGMLEQTAATQTNIGGIEKQRLVDLAQSDRDITGVGTRLASDIASAEAGIEAGRLGELRVAGEQAVVDEKNQFLNTLNQFSGDYQAEIDIIANDNDATNDWKIPYLKAARQDKIQQLGLDQEGNPIEQGVQFTVSQALQASKQGIWNEAIASALGLPFTEQGKAQAISSSGGGKTAQPTEAQQYVSYNNLKAELNAYFATEDKIKVMARDAQELGAKYGKDVVNAYFNELTAQPDVQTDEDYLKSLETEQGIDAILNPEEEVVEPDKDEALNVAFTEMMKSDDPYAWLEREKSSMTLYEYNQLKKALDE